jgi:uncharacterized protein YjbJ (UPF0337 family)
MLNTEEIRGHWGTIRGKLKEKWGQLTDDDLQIAGGNIDQLIGRIQYKVGAERRAVEEFLERVSENAPALQQAAKEKAQVAAQQLRQGVDDARERLHDGYEQVNRRMRDGYDQLSQRVQERYDSAGELVRRRPVQSVAATFIAGMLAGVVVGVLLRSNRS